MKIYKVSVGINANTNEGLSINSTISEYGAVEKSKIYEFNDGYSLKKLNKDKLNIVDTKIREDMYHHISYYCYALEDGIEDAKTNLMYKIKDEIGKREKAVNVMNKVEIEKIEFENKSMNDYI